MMPASATAFGPVRFKIFITRSDNSVTSSSTTCSLNFSLSIYCKKKTA